MNRLTRYIDKIKFNLILILCKKNSLFLILLNKCLYNDLYDYYKLIHSQYDFLTIKLSNNSLSDIEKNKLSPYLSSLLANIKSFVVVTCTHINIMHQLEEIFPITILKGHIEKTIDLVQTIKQNSRKMEFNLSQINI